MPTFDPYLRRMVNGPEAGQNTAVDGFTVGFLGSTDGTVYNAGSGLTLSGNVFAADLAAAGYRLALNGGTVSVARYMPVETVTGSSVTMFAGHAYKITATSSAVTLNAETVPANQFGLEGHLEIFVSGTGYVVTGTNVVLANALEPDAVTNCTVRFHDGIAILSVEDHNNKVREDPCLFLHLLLVVVVDVLCLFLPVPRAKFVYLQLYLPGSNCDDDDDDNDYQFNPMKR